MSTIVTLDQPKAEVVGSFGFFRVYGWTKEMACGLSGRLPLSELVSVHSFRWTARRAMRRWLEREAVKINLTKADTCVEETEVDR